MSLMLSPTSRDRIDAAIASLSSTGGTHLVPICVAVRDFGVAVLFAFQGCSKFDLPTLTRPFIAVLGDDTDKALGPAGFPCKSIHRLLRIVDGVFVISSKAYVSTYAAAAMLAGENRKNIVLIETRIEQEIPWMQFIQEHAPGLSIVNVTVREGTA